METDLSSKSFQRINGCEIVQEPPVGRFFQLTIRSGYKNGQIEVCPFLIEMIFLLNKHHFSYCRKLSSFYFTEIDTTREFTCIKCNIICTLILKTVFKSSNRLSNSIVNNEFYIGCLGQIIRYNSTWVK